MGLTIRLHKWLKPIVKNDLKCGIIYEKMVQNGMIKSSYEVKWLSVFY